MISEPVCILGPCYLSDVERYMNTFEASLDARHESAAAAVNAYFWTSDR